MNKKQILKGICFLHGRKLCIVFVEKGSSTLNREEQTISVGLDEVQQMWRFKVLDEKPRMVLS